MRRVYPEPDLAEEKNSYLLTRTEEYGPCELQLA